jgi:hypothetical protein
VGRNDILPGKFKTLEFDALAEKALIRLPDMYVALVWQFFDLAIFLALVVSASFVCRRNNGCFGCGNKCAYQWTQMMNT